MKENSKPAIKTKAAHKFSQRNDVHKMPLSGCGAPLRPIDAAGGCSQSHALPQAAQKYHSEQSGSNTATDSRPSGVGKLSEGVPVTSDILEPSETSNNANLWFVRGITLSDKKLKAQLEEFIRTTSLPEEK